LTIVGEMRRFTEDLARSNESRMANLSARRAEVDIERARQVHEERRGEAEALRRKLERGS